MTDIANVIEGIAAAGAGGLMPEARVGIAEALLRLRNYDGGFAGLAGESDPYYSFFTWLGLRALGADYERSGLVRYMAAHIKRGKTVDAVCARVLMRVEAPRPLSIVERWDCVRRFLGSDVYGALLSLFCAGVVSPRTARMIWWAQKMMLRSGGYERWPTPRLAAAALLAWLAGEQCGAVIAVLQARRCAGGGYASAACARPDLLGTAVARLALLLCARVDEAGMPSAAEDLAFCEACWMDDCLFGATPDAARGDAEHTFYGLLTLGTCRDPRWDMGRCAQARLP
ncbi:MAG: hypothetical protein PHU80_08135 [Kiritimatiellae bacterium]|nr:hypothetical protein [Kiritimatiellia bacterium]